jgi:hypothetical protein
MVWTANRGNSAGDLERVFAEETVTVHLFGIGRMRANESFPFTAWDDLYARIKSHLASNDVSLLWNEDETEATVLVGGFRPVGTVVLTEDLPE